MTPHAQLLVDLIRYVRVLQPGSIEATRIEPADLLVDQDMARDLEGVETMPDADTWLRVRKLAEPALPAPTNDVVQVLVGALDDPWTPPIAVADEPLDDQAVETLDEARQWIQEQWQPWARLAGPVRQSNALYQHLFHTMTRLKLEGGAEAREVVCGMGTGAWKTPEEVNLPILMQSCEVVMSGSGDGALEIKPSSAAPEIALRAFAGADRGAMALAKAWLNQTPWQEGEYSPGNREAWEDLVRGFAIHLDPAASMVEHARADEQLQVDVRWRFYLRDRPGDRVRRDLDALEEMLGAVDSDEDIPLFLRAMVDKQIDCQEGGRAIAWRGSEQVGKIQEGQQAQDLLFPLPYNDEQAQIIGHLSTGCGAIVQGPPGTGKSHTIANVICHYLAHGKRVLVAASAADALDVVREKIPEKVRDLVAALLSSDAQSLADFERSIMEIEHRLANMDEAREQERCEKLQELIDQTHEKIGAIDRELDARASKHREWLEVGGERMSMAQVARKWREGLDGGMTALPGPVPPRLDRRMDGIVAAARSQQAAMGDAINHAMLAEKLPASLPSADEVERMVQARAGVEGIGRRIENGELWGLASSDAAQVDQAAMALSGLGEQARQASEQIDQFIAKAGEHWRPTLAQVAQMPSDDPVVRRLRDIGHQAHETMDSLRQTDGRVETHGWMNRGEYITQAREALVRLAQGLPAFPWWQAPMRSQAMAVIEKTLVDGGPPADAGQWEVVRQRVEGQILARTLHTQWNGIAAELGMEQVSPKGSISGVMGMVAGAWHACEMARKYRAMEMEANGHITTIFMDPRLLGMDLPARISKALASIQAQVQVRGLREEIAGWDLAMEQLVQMGGFARHVAEHAPQDDAEAPAWWARAREQLDQLHGLARIRSELVETARRAGEMGFEAWANTWASGGRIDENWQEQWRWQQMGSALGDMGQAGGAIELLERRRALSRQLSEAIGEMVAVRAWMGAAANATTQVRRALKDYAGAVRKQGAGQGKRAARHRARAREAMKQAYAAVPCWVMPHGRVCESLPAELGLFDLVIIDEASQSDIQALPTLLRGKQLLIVGDDKQVSPAAVGVSEEKILQWKAADLARQPYKDVMTVDHSLYDLFTLVFSGRYVMLREHFRSVEPIIAYSNRHYYHDTIVPLRVPRANERIDPPLVDVLVRDGVYHNGVNLGEARWIADEIQAILADPAMEGKTIGVVTLTSNDKQAIAIHDELGERQIDMDAWVRRGLAVGPPPMFQGKERDIMFVSMVWDGRNRREGASNSQSFRQAFNVAMSRARDRVYLVRSNQDRPFKPDSILAQVVSHMQPSSHPPARGCHLDGDGFPEQVGRAAMERGFTVANTGLPDGIDLVLEDPASGARLAIACDGHQAPGMGGQWSDVVRRQRVLERAGWTVWRGFQAHFIADPEAFMAQVEQAALRAGVAPGAGEAASQLAVVEQRVVGHAVKVEALEEEPDQDAWPADPVAWPQDQEAMEAMCDSPFEREVLGHLLGQGYRVQPQYPVSGYRIDLVVAGLGGQRLAIECDGDSFHGLEKLESDRARQAWLEQTQALPFWRCWYSDWRDDRAGSVRKMMDALASAGVGPWA